jgi:hypothetical protein
MDWARATADVCVGARVWTQNDCNPYFRRCHIFPEGAISTTEWRSYMEGALQAGEQASADVLPALMMKF